jgi:hypothetical protein
MLSAERFKAIIAGFPHEVFRTNASTRIPSAEEEDLKFLGGIFHKEAASNPSLTRRLFKDQHHVSYS